ncbi:MAG: hypothetical protein WA888_09960 [Burkholderiaceae bacterium]
MKAVYCVLAAGLAISACATTPPVGERTKLTRDELSTMRPQIADHLQCMAKSAVVYSSGTSDLGVLVDTAAYTCQPKLGALSERLKHFNLTPNAQISYVRAVELASRSIITDRIVKARIQGADRADDSGKSTGS